jgi:hypothetical protein
MDAVAREKCPQHVAPMAWLMQLEWPMPNHFLKHPQTNAAYMLSAMGTYQISQGAQLFAHSFQRYPCMHCTDSWCQSRMDSR